MSTASFWFVMWAVVYPTGDVLHYKEQSFATTKRGCLADAYKREKLNDGTYFDAELGAGRVIRVRCEEHVVTYAGDES